MPSVLIIDDYEPTRDTYSTILQLAGFRTATAATGVAGIALAVQEPFHVILVDLQLPDVSGIDVVRELKCRDIVVRLVIVTAFAGFDSAFQSAEAGADGYVDGPLFGDEIVDVVQQAIHGPHPVRHPARRAVNVDEREPRRSSMDPRVRKAIDLIDAELHKSPVDGRAGDQRRT